MSNPLERPAGDKVVDPESMATHVKAALDESDMGELEIAIPPAVQQAIQQAVQTDEGKSDKSGMVIRIFYELAEPEAGLHFILPNEKSYPNRPPHVYTHNLSGARCWMPCFDTPVDRCTWVLEFEVAADLTVVASGACPSQPQEILSKDNSHAHPSAMDVDVPLRTSSSNAVPLPNASAHSKDVSLKRYTFVVTEPVLASSIGFAVGKFETSYDTELPPGELTFYSLPGRSSLLENTVGFMGQSLKYFETLLHSPLPGKHLKVVFVDDAPTKVAATTGLLLCSTHLLHSQDVIDQTYATRYAMSVGLAMQWFPTLVDYKTITDAWVVSGIIGYLAYLNYQKMFGLSELRAAVLKDTKYVLQATRLAAARKMPGGLRRGLDDLDEPKSGSAAEFITNTLYTQAVQEYSTHMRHNKDRSPVDLSVSESVGDAPFLQDVLLSECDMQLYCANYISPTELNTKYYRKRATLVILQLEKIVGPDILQQLLALLVRRDENTGKPTHQQLTARAFFKICKKSVFQDFGEFENTYIHQHGIPHLIVGFQYHPDQRKTEFAIKQDLAWSREVRKHLLIRVHAGTTDLALGSSTASGISTSTTATEGNNEEDAEALMEDHEIALDGEYQTYFTKSKASMNDGKSARKKRKKAKKSNDMDETDDEDDDEDSIGGAEGAAMRLQRTRADLGYIRIDPEGEWLKQLSFRQAEYMWINQLANDRDVNAQFEAIEGLVRAAATDAACVAIHGALNNAQNFFKVRMRAASALGVLATRFRKAFELLQQYFLLHYYDLPDVSRSSTTTHSTASSSAVTTPGTNVGMDSRPSTPATGAHSSQISRPYTPVNGASSTASQMDYMDEDEEDATLRPNDFSNFEDYFVQKAVMHAIATIRDEKDYTPSEVIEFLFDLLNSNDNSRNAYSDNYYVASLIHALTYIRSDNKATYMEIVKQSERYLGKELMMPCYHNVIAQACLHLLATLQAAGRLDVALNEFVRYFSYGNLPAVRAVAIRCFIRVGLCIAQTEAACEDVFNRVEHIVRNDPSMWFKHKTAFALATALESGVDLDPLLSAPKINVWRRRLYDLVNSKSTAFSPRLRLMLLNALATLGGEAIADPKLKLPPRKINPNRPMKSNEINASRKRTNNPPQPKRSNGYNNPPPYDNHSHATSSLSSATAAAASLATGFGSERPQRKAAQRARLSEPDPLAEVLGSELFVTPAATITAPSTHQAQNNISPSAAAPMASPPASDIKPRLILKKNFGAASTATTEASSATPSPRGDSMPPPSVVPGAAPTPSTVTATAPTPTATTITAPPVGVDPSSTVTPVKRGLLKIKTSSTPSAAASPAVPSSSVQQSPPTIKVESMHADAPQAPVQAPVIQQAPINPPVAHVAPTAPAEGAASPAPAKVGGTRFVLKRATPAVVDQQEPIAKKPKLEEDPA